MKDLKFFGLLTVIMIIMTTTTSCLSLGNVKDTSASGTDYGEIANWLTIPDNKTEHPVDVFFVYPTVYQGKGVQDITDPEQVKVSMEPLYTQASVFSGQANIYAPMYRQLGKAGFNEPDFLDQLKTGEQDIEDALLYYIENLNDGRPFFIAAHSQGSSSLMSVLDRIWGTTGAEERMIAAYILGFSITEEETKTNPAIRMSERPDETGCFISWNSIRDEVQEQSVQILPGAIVTNPLNWNSVNDGGAFIPAEKNLGSVFFTGEAYEKHLSPEFTSAQVINGGLCCQPADESILSPYPIEGIFHPDDYSLFYENLRENIGVRIESYVKSL